MEFEWTVGGGLGDVIWHAFKGEGSLIPHFLESNPDCEITAVVPSHNNFAAEFFQHCPLFKSVRVEPYQSVYAPPSHKELFSCVSAGRFESRLFPMWLSADERRDIENRKDYILFHPFAGEMDRNIPNPSAVASRLAKETGLRVLVVGGTNKRQIDRNVVTNFESFESADPMVDNLVGRLSIRHVIGLARNAKYCVATHSCFLMAAWTADRPSLCIAPDHLVSFLVDKPYSYHPYLSYLFRPGNYYVPFSQMDHLGRFLDEFFQNLRSPSTARSSWSGRVFRPLLGPRKFPDNNDRQ